MGAVYAFLVECPRLFGTKKVVLGGSLEMVVDWLTKEMQRLGMVGCRIESIVNVGEVVND